MNKPIPRDIDDFLVTLGTFEEGDPEAFEMYAKATANLLWGKYFMLHDPSIQVMSTYSDRFTS